jgi:hypothetical protein
MTDYASASRDKTPLVYPGERPEASYVTDGEMVSALTIGAHDEELYVVTGEHAYAYPLDEYLEERNAPPVADRIPMIGFGANVCPGSLFSKLQKVGRPDALVVPTLYANLPGYDVVWSGGPGGLGNFNAVLYSGPETEETSVQVGINLLTPEQVLVMHATELNYQLEPITVTVGDGELTAYYYTGTDSIYVENGKPFAVESIPAENRQLESRNTVELVEKVLAMNSVRTVINKRRGVPESTAISPQEYAEYALSLTPNPETKTPRADLKKAVQAELRQLGVIGQTSTSEQQVESWVNVSTLRTMGGDNDIHVYRLPTSELAIDQWPDKEARQKVLRGLQTHFHRFLNNGTS